jgi:hypothetical protein
MTKTRLFCFVQYILTIATPMFAAEAKPFYIPVTGARDIVFAQDHLTVSLLQGWVSSKDSFLKALFSRADKL